MDCNFHTGDTGRTYGCEVLPVDRGIRRATAADEPTGRLRKMAAANRTQALFMVARQRVLDGVTTVDEMHRV